MSAIVILCIYVVVGAFAFSYVELSIWKIIAGGLFGASIGVNELKGNVSFTTLVIRISGALCMILSMMILGLLSTENSLSFYIFGVFSGILIYFVHAK